VAEVGLAVKERALTILQLPRLLSRAIKCLALLELQYFVLRVRFVPALQVRVWTGLSAWITSNIPGARARRGAAGPVAHGPARPRTPGLRCLIREPRVPAVVVGAARECGAWLRLREACSRVCRAARCSCTADSGVVGWTPWSHLSLQALRWVF